LQLGQSSARLGGNPDLPVDSYPTVRTALAELDRARLDLDRTIIESFPAARTFPASPALCEGAA